MKRQPSQKTQASAKLQEDIATYLSNGGQMQSAPQQDHKPVTARGTATHRSKFAGVPRGIL